MAKLSQMMNTKNIMVVLIVVELAACAALGFVVLNKQKEIKANSELTNTLMEQVANLEKTTVPKDDYDNLIKQLQSLKIAAASMAMTSNQPMDRPDQICNVVKQILARQQQMLNSAAAAVAAANAAATTSLPPAGEVDFLVSVVEKAISQQGVVDTLQTEKFALTLYHMQKVLDAIGYKLNDTIKTTNQAVLKFQTDNQLKADGKIGAKTWAKVRDAWNTKRPGGPIPSATAPSQTKPQELTLPQAKPQEQPLPQTRQPRQTSPLTRPRGL
jgi:hypothetical protein